MAVKKTKKLSELQTITSATSENMIPVVDSNGNVNPIKLSDLAQVVAELIPAATAEKNGLMSKDFFNIGTRRTLMLSDDNAQRLVKIASLPKKAQDVGYTDTRIKLVYNEFTKLKAISGTWYVISGVLTEE